MRALWFRLCVALAGPHREKPHLPSRISAGTAEPLRVSPPEAVAYPLELLAGVRDHRLLIPAPMNPCAFCSRAFDGELGCRCHLHSYLSDLVLDARIQFLISWPCGYSPAAGLARWRSRGRMTVTKSWRK